MPWLKANIKTDSFYRVNISAHNTGFLHAEPVAFPVRGYCVFQVTKNYYLFGWRLFWCLGKSRDDTFIIRVGADVIVRIKTGSFFRNDAGRQQGFRCSHSCCGCCSCCSSATWSRSPVGGVNELTLCSLTPASQEKLTHSLGRHPDYKLVRRGPGLERAETLKQFDQDLTFSWRSKIDLLALKALLLEIYCHYGSDVR